MLRPIPITNGGATINGQRLTGIARNVIVSENEGKSRYYAMSFIQKQEVLMTIRTD
jgi:hypothetical protein